MSASHPFPGSFPSGPHQGFSRLRVWIVVPAFLLAAVLAGCGTTSQEENAASRDQARPPTGEGSDTSTVAMSGIDAAASGEEMGRTTEGSETVPADLRIVIGEGGGVTGRWTGRTITGDGTWYRWEGTTAEAGMEPAGTLTSDDVRALWTRIVRAGFFDLEAGEPGNLIRFIRVTAEGNTHEVRWVPQLGAEESPPPAQALYSLCWEITNPGDVD